MSNEHNVSDHSFNPEAVRSVMIELGQVFLEDESFKARRPIDNIIGILGAGVAYSAACIEDWTGQTENKEVLIKSLRDFLNNYFTASLSACADKMLSDVRKDKVDYSVEGFYKGLNNNGSNS